MDSTDNGNPKAQFEEHLASLKRCTKTNAKQKSFRRVLDMVSDIMEDNIVEPILVSMDQEHEESFATESSRSDTELVTCS